MPFCYSPWTNIDIDPTGKITPCCKFQTQSYSQVFNLQHHSIDEYIASDFLRTVKQELDNGQWPQGCERCRIEEENSIKSKRQLDQERWPAEYNTYNRNDGFITASIAFGNTCNLSCITCSSYASSRWHKEYKDIYGIDIPHFKFYRKNFVKDFIKLAPNLCHVDIPGGEPFLSGVDEQKQLLQHYVDSGQAGSITLHYTTNATIFPDQEWWDLWQHFKEIDLQLSLDGIKDRYEYIRYPADWKTVLSNTHRYCGQEQQLANFRISVSHTVSAYNIYYLDEFFEHCEQIGLPKPWLGRVHRPEHMRPTVWSDSARSAIVDRLSTSKYEDVRTWAQLVANNNDSQHFDTFVERTRQHDEYRKLNFATTFPEMAQYLNEQ